MVFPLARHMPGCRKISMVKNISYCTSKIFERQEKISLPTDILLLDKNKIRSYAGDKIKTRPYALILRSSSII
jgi:hypothetical protein